MDADNILPGRWRHYRREHEPRSSGRVLLSEALLTHAMLNWGMSGEDIADAFEEGGSDEDRKRVVLAIKLFEAPLQDGRFRTWARPFGGGAAHLLEPHHWEIDDFLPRFATSALNFDRPFDEASDPTHWIFVEDIVIDALHDLHRDDAGMARRAHRPRASADPAEHADAAVGKVTHVEESPLQDEGLLRRPAVERLVGMKKSTIYKRIKQGRFPEPVRNGERISSWREAEIRAWLRNPR